MSDMWFCVTNVIINYVCKICVYVIVVRRSRVVRVEHQFLHEHLPKIVFQMKHALIINRNVKIVPKLFSEHGVEKLDTIKWY